MLLRKCHAAATRLSQLPCPMPPFCAAVAKADTTAVQSDIVGYGYYEVPIGYSIWSPVFKNLDDTAFDLVDITPATLNRVNISGNNKVVVFKLATTGAYGTSYVWYGTKGGWSSDNGATIIGKGVVTFTSGEGFAMNNSVKTLNGDESTARTATASAITMLTSGAVDLVCKNEVPVGYSISGNATPLPIDLVDIYPTTLAGETITGNNKIVVFKLGDDGKYGTSYVWYGTKGGWSSDNGATVIGKGVVTFEPGEGFAMNNGLKTLNGVESTARTATAAAAVIVLPKPIND